MVKEYIVFSLKPHYFAAVMSCIYCQLQRKDVPLDKLITGHVSFRKKGLGLLCPLQLGFTKGHLVSVQVLLENYSNDRDEQGQCFLRQRA